MLAKMGKAISHDETIGLCHCCMNKDQKNNTKQKKRARRINHQTLRYNLKREIYKEEEEKEQ
jgi:hypothetical protein